MQEKTEDKKKATKECLMFTLVPFVIHGVWDAVISLATHFTDSGSNHDFLGVLLILLVVIFGVLYTLLTIKKTIKFTKQYKLYIQNENKESN